MDSTLQHETERLARSWMRHEPAWLRDYLVRGVEDPRINLQSILARHFLARDLFDDEFNPLMEQECRFAAVLAWLLKLTGGTSGADEFEAVLFALRRGADNAEGVEIPHFVRRAFATLPAGAGNVVVPNYIEEFLSAAQVLSAPKASGHPTLDTFQALWRVTLEARPVACRAEPTPLASTTPLPLAPAPPDPAAVSVLEPACGSANDYRFLHAYGLARWLDYTGFDLCHHNIANARALFPAVRFQTGNVFEIDAPDKSFDLCVAHDLFEHLSLDGMRAAVGELCRVTRRGMCLSFFQMDEIRDHVVRPVEEYYWNLLSMERMRELFVRHGFTSQVLHLGTFLRRAFGSQQTHNPNAYTFYLAAG